MEATANNGVLKILTREDRYYYNAKDVMELLGVGRDKAYRVIRTLRKEMIDAGMLNAATLDSGKIPKWYFKQQCGIREE